MSSPLEQSEETILDEEQLCKEIGIIFDETTKPYDYIEIMQRAEDKGLYRKANIRDIAMKVLERIHGNIEEKARQQQ